MGTANKSFRSRKVKPSKAARRAAKRISNTKAELLDTITSQHHGILELEKRLASRNGTILGMTRAIAQITDADELRVCRLKMAIFIRRQLEKRLREALGELMAFYELPRRSGYVHSEMVRIAEIRELAK